MNKPLLQKVKKFIRENPERLQMWKYGGSDDCGCIAHLAFKLAGHVPGKDLYEASAALELSEDESKSLFHVHLWPSEFAYLYSEAAVFADHKSKAKTTIARINHFIKTGK